MTLAGKPLSSYRAHVPMAARLEARWRRIEKPPLWEFVLLSMLVHAVAIALFGAPGGGSSEGRAVWGALQVVLQGAALDTGPQLKIDQGIGIERPDDKTRRPRPTPRAAPQRPEPAAPTLKSEPRIESIAPPVLAPPAEATPAEVPLVIPPLMNRIVTPERKFELPEFHVPPPTPVQAAPSPPPAPAAAELPAVVERPAPRVERAPAEAPPIPAPLVQPRVERAIAEPPPVPAPMVQPLPPPPLPEMLPVPPITRPVETRVVPAVTTPPQIERAPVESPAIPIPPIESIAPRASEPAATPAESAPAREAPVAPPPVAAPVQQREAPARIERAPAIREEATPRFNAPGPSSDSIRERAPASSYDPTAPSVDLDAVRKRAAELARSGTGQRAILAFPMPPVPPKKSKLEDALDKAHKPDCRTAYSALGLAAVVPLIANEFGEGTCKW
jgi:hypothetical protein